MSNCADQFEELVHEQEIILSEDLAALKKMPERSRIERYNTLKSNEEEFRWEFTKECPDFLTDGETDRVRSEFRLARLLIAASFYDAGSVPAAMADDFVDTELQAVVDFERYKRFDALTRDQIEEKIFRMDGEVYELVTEYTSTQIANMDDLMDDPAVQQDVMERLLERYEERRDKIRQGFFTYVEAHGLEHMVESIEDAVKAVVDAADEREHIRDELRNELDALSSQLDERLRAQTKTLESEFGALESQLASETVDPDEFHAEIQRVRQQNREIAASQNAALSELDDQIDQSVQFKAKLKTQIQNLEQAREDAMQAERERARDEATELIETELQNLRDERGQLQEEIQQLKRERERIETARDRLDEQQESLNARVEDVKQSVSRDDQQGLDGEGVVTAQIGRLLELDYLGRFDISMQEVETIETGNAHFEVPANYWEGRSERRNERMRLVDLLEQGEDIDQYPANRSARYEITQSRYLGLSRETEMVIEGRVHSHLEAFTTNGFDANPADLDDLLSIVNDAVYEAEQNEFTYLLGVASPTGWTDRVVDQIKSDEFARTRFSQRVSVCLIDLQDGSLIYDESDPVVAENASVFEPPIDAERVEDCMQTIRTEYVDDIVADTVLLRDVVDQHGYDSHIAKRAFDRLEANGRGEQFYVDDLGLTLEVGE